MNPASQTPLADPRVAAERAEANKEKKEASTPLNICRAGRRFSFHGPGCRTHGGPFLSWRISLSPYLRPSLARKPRPGQPEDRRPRRRRGGLACEHVQRFIGGEGRASSSSPSPQPHFRWPGTAPRPDVPKVLISAPGEGRAGDASFYAGRTGN